MIRFDFFAVVGLFFSELILQPVFLTLASHISYLDQNILAEARERIFESIKADVMPLPHGAAHSIAHLLRAAPLPVLTHTVDNRACYASKRCKNYQLKKQKYSHSTRCCSPQRWSVPMHMACCYGNRDTVPVQCSLCADVPEINQLINQSLSNRKEFAALSSTTHACKDNTAPTVPGGHRQPGMQARLTQGKSRFWQVLAHSRPFSPVSQSVRMSGGGHWAALRSGYTKNAACLELYQHNDQTDRWPLPFRANP